MSNSLGTSEEVKFALELQKRLGIDTMSFRYDSENKVFYYTGLMDEQVIHITLENKEL